jgi:hypothetical protein
MSSATSTRDPLGSPKGLTTDATSRTDGGIRPWQFFVLAALGCATAVTWSARSEGVTAVVLLTILMGTAALVGLAAYRTIGPIVSRQSDRTAMIGQRTRAALEREKMLTLRAIKDLEFDRAMKKVSEDDFREMSGPLRTRAARLMRQLDAGSGYRERIEQDLAKRRSDRSEEGHAAAATIDADGGPPDVGVARTCANCSTRNDTDARFCKACGATL